MLRATLVSLFSVASSTFAAEAPVLVLGVLPTDCRSVLTIGVVACGEPTADSAQSRSISEAQVTEYLAQYGKPPREAVRALLDPTDANIAAWLRKQRQVISIASYVAHRMTEMQSQLETDHRDGSPTSVSYLPAMIQIRATLYLNSRDASSLRAARVLQRVVARHPSIDGRLVQVEPTPSGLLSTWVARLDTMLPVSILPPGSTNDAQVPSLLIEDLRYGSSQRLDATDITPEQLQDQIASLRAAAEARDRLSRAAEPLP
jgi:hypothetical protein